MVRFVLFILAVLLVAYDMASGAEVRMRTQVRSSSGVIRLGDVAEIFAAESWQVDQLAAVELGPAPAAGMKRFVRAREVQDALFMRGINLSLHQLSGAVQTEVLGRGDPVVDEKPVFRADEATRTRAERQVAELILRAIQRQTGTREPWQARVALTDEQIAVVISGRRLTAEGGASPWTGLQAFTLRQDGREDVAPFEVEAEVTLPPAVVVAVRPLPPDTILHAGDLTLKTGASVSPGTQPYYRIEDVVGQSTTYSVATGAVIGRNTVRRPVVVRKGAAVTLYAKSSGLRVRTTVRAREDGALDDLITVESLTNREPFFARVTGVQEAEVFAAPAEATSRTAAAVTGDRFAPPTGGLSR